MRWKTIGARALVAALGILSGLGAAELLLRLVPLAPGWGPSTVTEKQFSTLPGLYAPHQHLIDRRKRALPHVVTINSLGYRGTDFPRAKPPGEFRILMVGDSFTYGDFVDDSATLPAQLGERVARSCRGSRVINAGVGGSTIIEEAHMATRARSVSPDLVILTFTENDVADLAIRPSMWDMLASSRRAKSRFPLSAVYPILHQTALWNLALSIRSAARARSGPATAFDVVTQAQDSLVTRLRTTYTGLLRALRDTLSASAIPLVLAIYPAHHALLDSTRRGQLAWVYQTGVALGLPTLLLLPSLQGTGKAVTQLYLLPHDGHPSPLGYATAADALAAFVVSHSSLRSRCQP